MNLYCKQTYTVNVLYLIANGHNSHGYILKIDMGPEYYRLCYDIMMEHHN